jgi:hypothetical protein
MSVTYRIAYLLKQAVIRMATDEKAWGHFEAHAYERSATGIKLAVAEPDGKHEVCYEIKVKRIGRRRVAT